MASRYIAQRYGGNSTRRRSRSAYSCLKDFSSKDPSEVIYTLSFVLHYLTIWQRFRKKWKRHLILSPNVMVITLMQNQDQDHSLLRENFCRKIHYLVSWPHRVILPPTIIQQQPRVLQRKGEVWIPNWSSLHYPALLSTKISNHEFKYAEHGEP